MRVAIHDGGLLRALKPLELAGYLKAKGWRQQAELGNRGTLWLLEVDHTEFDVTLPARHDSADYALRIGEVIGTLAEAEGRSQLDVLRDLQTTTADLIRVRVFDRDGEAGTLPLANAVALVEHTRDMMLAAACAAISKRPYYAKRKAQQAMDYLGQVRMGQTETGSYVFTVLSPVAPALRAAQGSLALVEPEDPYARQVTKTLMEGLAALNQAAYEAVIRGDVVPFAAAVAKGVSANLCDAVVGLSAAGSGGVDVRVAWSRTRSVDDRVPGRVMFGADSVTMIEEAARHFRQSASWEDFEVEGVVTRLDRGATATEGDVTITGNVEGHLRRITLALDPETYSRAVEAHDARRTVRCVGELTKEGRGYRLQNPRQFEIVGD